MMMSVRTCCEVDDFDGEFDYKSCTKFTCYRGVKNGVVRKSSILLFGFMGLITLILDKDSKMLNWDKDHQSRFSAA